MTGMEEENEGDTENIVAAVVKGRKSGFLS